MASKKQKKPAKKENNSPIAVSVSNLGPIAKAKDIEIKPLTVLVGPSEQGKTYFAIFVFTLFEFVQNVFSTALFEFEILGGFNKLDESGNSSKEKKKDIRKYLIDQVESRSVMLFAEIGRNIGVDHRKNLIRHKTRTIPKFSFLHKNISINLDMKDKFASISVSDENKTLQKALRATGEQIGTPWFLPAGRSGLTQAYHVIAATLLTRATAHESFNMPTLRGVDAEYLKNSLELVPDGRSPSRPPFVNLDYIIRHKERKYYNVLQEHQKDLFGGVVKIEENEDKQSNRTAMYFHDNRGNKIPIRTGASMLQELAPFFLQVQQLAREGDTIIIEEPESHLHPDAQRKIASVIVDLINKGLKIIVTTHSPLFLEQIELEIRKKKIASSAVSLYQFKKSARANGSEVSKIDYDEEEGFIVDDYESVFSEIHNEMIEAMHGQDND